MTISFGADQRARSLVKDIALLLKEDGITLSKPQYLNIHTLIKSRYEDVEELAWQYEDLDS